MSIASKNIFTWDSSKDRGPRGFPGAAGGVSIPAAGDILTNLLTVDGTGSGLDADLLDGYHASAFALAGGTTFTGKLSITTTSDYEIEFSGAEAANIRHATAGQSLFLLAPTGGTLQFGANGTNGQAILSAGKFGIARTPTTYPLEVEGDISFGITNSGGSLRAYIADIVASRTTSEAIRLIVNSGTAMTVLSNTKTGFGFSTPLSKVCINGGLHVGGESDAGDNNLFIDGIVQEPNFDAGWQGTNWQIQADGDAEFNNVRIRGGLSVYELIINQLHYQNGGLIIGAGAGKIATITTATAGSEVMTFHDPEGNAMVPFSAGSIVMCQRVDISKTVANGYTGDVVKKIVRQVASVSSMSVTFTTTTGWAVLDDTGVFEVGDEVCAIGHTSNTSLDSSIYLSATDADNPFMRVFDGVNTYGKFSLGDKSTIKLQLGNLASLASYDILPASPGYGLYSNNAYLTGRIVLPTAGMTNEGSSASDIRIYAGATYTNRATAPFMVTQDGSLTATGIATLGTSPVSVGGLSQNVAIEGPDIWENSYNGDNSAIHINRVGYGGGVTKYRDFKVYDGKGNVMISCDGSAATITILDSIATYRLAATETIKVGPTASPPLTEEGVIYADTDHHLYYYNGTSWVQLDN